MTQNFASLLRQYDYTLPPDLIAKEPAQPRDSARLLVYDRNKDAIRFDTFANITNDLPKNAVLVLNETKVIPARMRLQKETGGMIGALYVETCRGKACLAPTPTIRVLADGTFKSGDRLGWTDNYFFTVIAREEKEAVLQPSFPSDQLMTLLEKFGETPLPPYMKDSPLSEPARREEYQTIFAREQGSVAAPTAGLHFTKELIKKIEQHGCTIEKITLHVNLGTFAPLTEENIRERRLHREHFSIAPDVASRLNDAKKHGRPIVAVGTTVVRGLESACAVGARHALPLLEKLSGTTDIFITEHDHLHFVDHLITNFHVPRSSLLMLVAAFTGREKLLELYQKAIGERMRFFSFGDGMLIL